MLLKECSGVGRAVQQVRYFQAIGRWAAVAAMAFGALPDKAAAAKPIVLEGQRELFVDDYLIDRMDGAELELQRPVEKEVVLIHDQPWEGNTSCYHTVFQDGDLYRMYYRGAHVDDSTGEATHPEVYCYAESKDGIHWTKPKLGIHEAGGSQENNIIIGSADHAHCLAPFKDGNPDAAETEKYKAIARGEGGLVTYKSADAIHWEPLSEEAVITDGRFDSLNVACWDAHRGRYVAFFRDLRNDVRDIKTCTSADFKNWKDPVWLEYNDVPTQHLYTNGIVAYERAPHLFVGLVKRLVLDPNPAEHRYPGVSDCVLMTSRDGEKFNRWDEAFVRPGPQPDRWVNRNNLAARGIVQTKADVPNAPDELSIYLTEGYYRGPGCRLRRYTLRQDGFVSVSAPPTGGEMVTKPLVLKGTSSRAELLVNYATSAAGSVRCEIQGVDGEAIPGFSLDECTPLIGDKMDAKVSWGGNADLSELADTPVRLRFVMHDADLHAIEVP